MKTITLGELLTEEQAKRVYNILTTSPTEREVIQNLKDYFRTISAQLEAKGILPDYLAYATVAAAEQMVKHNSADN